MSYILDALKKSDQERKRGEVPTIVSGPGDSDEQAVPAPKRYGPWVLAGGFAIATAVLAWVIISRDAPLPAPAQPALVATQQAPQQPVEATPEKPVLQASRAQTEATPKPAPDPAPETSPKPAPEPVPDPAPEKIAAAEPVAVMKPAPAPEIAPTPAPVAAPVIAPALPRLGRADAHLDRGWSSIDKGLYNQALADFKITVEMEPGFIDGWFAQGWALEKSGKDMQAMESYSRAIALKPNHVGALFSRGYLNLFGNDPAAAERDFSTTLNFADGDIKLYTHLWLYVARARQGKEANTVLARESLSANLSKWPGVMVRYYLGTVSEAEAVRAIEQTAPADLAARRCAGYFFLGEKALLQGDPDRARNFFEKTLQSGVDRLRQFDGARRELARLAH